MRYTKILTGLMMAGIGLFACRKASDLAHYQPVGGANKSDTLVMINMLPDSSLLTGQRNGYVLYVNDSMVNFSGRSLGYNGGGYYNTAPCYGPPPGLPIPSSGGTFDLKLAAYINGVDTPPLFHPPVSRVVCEGTINVPANSGFGNVYFYDSIPGKHVMRYMPRNTSDPGAPAPGTFKVRVINFAYDLQDYNNYISASLNSAGTQYNIQLQTQDSTVIKGMENLTFGQVSPYLQYDYGTWQFKVYNTTTQSYIDNSGPLNDIAGTFDLTTATQLYALSTPTSTYNFLYPNYNSQGLLSPNMATLNYGNIGSYAFSAGGCYTIIVVGKMYVVSLDRQYEPGTLDNFGKIQILNAAPGQTDLEVTVSAGGKTVPIPSLPFGGCSDPLIVPSGAVNCVFSSHGQTLYSYTVQVPRLGNYLLGYTTDLKKVPFVLPQPIFLTTDDYFPYSYSSPASFQFCKVQFLNLIPDAGKLFLTTALPVDGNYEEPILIYPHFVPDDPDIPYKGSEVLREEDGITPPTLYNVRFSAKRTDSLANQLVATLPDPFPVKPAPGTYTLVAIGLLNAPDPSSAMRLVMIRNTNFIPKAY